MQRWWTFTLLCVWDTTGFLTPPQGRTDSWHYWHGTKQKSCSSMMDLFFMNLSSEITRHSVQTRMSLVWSTLFLIMYSCQCLSKSKIRCAWGWKYCCKFKLQYLSKMASWARLRHLQCCLSFLKSICLPTACPTCGVLTGTGWSCCALSAWPKHWQRQDMARQLLSKKYWWWTRCQFAIYTVHVRNCCASQKSSLVQSFACIRFLMCWFLWLIKHWDD